jgi:hypothetical protein
MKQKEMRKKICKQIENLFEWDEVMDIKMFEEKIYIYYFDNINIWKNLIGKNNWTFNSQNLINTFKILLV